MYSVPGEPTTAYDATSEVETVNGETVRWVFMHYFKPGTDHPPHDTPSS